VCGFLLAREPRPVAVAIYQVVPNSLADSVMQSTAMICKQIENAQAEIRQTLDPPKADEAGGPGEHELAILQRHIAELHFSPRMVKLLVRTNIGTIDELIRKPARDLALSKGFGIARLMEVHEKLMELATTLRVDEGQRLREPHNFIR
jgi:DNA-directed RNA polymerase alpha subunit